MRRGGDFVERCTRVGSFGDSVTGVLQSQTQNAAEAVFVFNEENVWHCSWSWSGSNMTTATKRNCTTGVRDSGQWAVSGRQKAESKKQKARMVISHPRRFE